MNLYYTNYNSTGSGVKTDSTYAVVRIDGRKEIMVVSQMHPIIGNHLMMETHGQLDNYLHQSFDKGVTAFEYGAGKFIAIPKDYDRRTENLF